MRMNGSGSHQISGGRGHHHIYKVYSDFFPHHHQEENLILISVARSLALYL